MDMSEPQGRGVAWTEERGTSDEGPPPEAARQARRRLWRGPGSRADAGLVPITEAERAVVSPSAPVTALTIDALGRKCPIPIIMLAEQIRDVPLGAVVAVLADDPAAYTDIPSWCMMKAHEFAGYQELPRGGWALYIRRRL
jgi:tRNA 2-thiouridine synthesizing protein A